MWSVPHSLWVTLYSFAGLLIFLVNIYEHFVICFYSSCVLGAVSLDNGMSLLQCVCGVNGWEVQNNQPEFVKMAHSYIFFFFFLVKHSYI